MILSRKFRSSMAFLAALGLASGAALVTAPAAQASRSVVHTAWWNGPHAYSDCVSSSNNFVNWNGYRIVKPCYQVKSTNRYPSYMVQFVK